MGDIIPTGGVTKLDLPADRILEAAKGYLEGVVLIGFDKDGQVYADGGTVMWLLEACKTKMMASVEDD